MSFESRISRFCKTHPNAPREHILASRLLFRTARLLHERIDLALAPFSLNMSQYLVLSMLAADEGEPSSPSEVGSTLDATRTQMTRALDALQAQGLIRRRASAQDRRSLELELTEAGRQMVENAAPAVHAVYAQAWSAVKPADRTVTTSSLQRLHTGLESTQP
ncbi:MAG TPA: MarR family transcriptional regulator [Burkholderiaceae bacterium]|nr:MarR family transcriptional regulator [Burkholderiaceae bacterium]